MNNFKVSALIVLFSTSALKATTVNLNLEFDPQVNSYAVGPASTNPAVEGSITPNEYTTSSDYWTSEVLMPFNNPITLSAGDILQLNVHFTDNKMLEVINSPDKVQFDFLLSSIENWGGWAGIQLSNLEVDITNYQNLQQTHLSGPVWTNDYVTFLDSFAWLNLSSGLIGNGSMIGDFTLGITIPSIIPGKRTPPPTTTYMFNYIKIESPGMTSLSPGEFLRVVPEPASFLLFAFAGITCLFFKNQRTV
jgi:hypothetical protein